MPRARFQSRAGALSFAWLAVGLVPPPTQAQTTAREILRDSTFVTRLTRTPVEVGSQVEPGAHDPSWSPDGNWILYAFTDDLQTNLWQLRRMRPDGADDSLILAGVEGESSGDGVLSPRPTLSPDGATVAYLSAGRLLLVGVDGTDPRPLATAPRQRGRAAWSHDGSRLAYLDRGGSDDTGIFVHRLDDLQVSRIELSSYSRATLGNLWWSADDEHLIYADDTGATRLRVGDGQLERLVSGTYADAIVSPTGSWLLFAEPFGYSPEHAPEGFYPVLPSIHLLDVGAGETGRGRQLIYSYWWPSPFDVSGHDWSPDERRLVFSVCWFGLSEIYVLDVPSALAAAPAHIVTGEYEVASAAELEALFPQDGAGTAFAGVLRIHDSELTDLTPLLGLRRFLGELSIAGNGRLQSLRGLDSLTTHHGHRFASLLRIADNPVLHDLTALRRLRRASRLTVENLTVLNSLELPSLQAATLRVRDNASLRLLAAPEFTGGQLYVTENDSLREARFPGYRLTDDPVRGPGGRGIRVASNPRLESLTGFGLLEEAMFVDISNNPRLRALPDFARLRRTHEHLIISDNDAITHVDGLSAMRAVGSIPFHNEERDGDSPLHTGNHFEMSRNDSLRDLSALLGKVSIESWPNEPFLLQIAHNRLLPSDQADSLAQQIGRTHDLARVSVFSNGPEASGAGDVPTRTDPSVTATVAEVGQPYPNPATAGATFRVDVPAIPRDVRMQVYNSAGQLVRTLYDARMPTGRNLVEWNGLDRHGQRVASGVYFIRARIVLGGTHTVRMIVLPPR